MVGNGGERESKGEWWRRAEEMVGKLKLNGWETGNERKEINNKNGGYHKKMRERERMRRETNNPVKHAHYRRRLYEKNTHTTITFLDQINLFLIKEISN